MGKHLAFKTSATVLLITQQKSVFARSGDATVVNTHVSFYLKNVAGIQFELSKNGCMPLALAFYKQS